MGDYYSKSVYMFNCASIKVVINSAAHTIATLPMRELGVEMSGHSHYLDCTSAMKRSYSLCTWVSGGGSEGKGGCAGLGPPPGVAFAPVAIPGAPPYIPALIQARLIFDSRLPYCKF